MATLTGTPNEFEAITHPIIFSFSGASNFDNVNLAQTLTGNNVQFFLSGDRRSDYVVGNNVRVVAPPEYPDETAEILTSAYSAFTNITVISIDLTYIASRNGDVYYSPASNVDVIEIDILDPVNNVKNDKKIRLVLFSDLTGSIDLREWLKSELQVVNDLDYSERIERISDGMFRYKIRFNELGSGVNTDSPLFVAVLATRQVNDPPLNVVTITQAETPFATEFDEPKLFEGYPFGLFALNAQGSRSVFINGSHDSNFPFATNEIIAVIVDETDFGTSDKITVYLDNKTYF